MNEATSLDYKGPTTDNPIGTKEKTLAIFQYV